MSTLVIPLDDSRSYLYCPGCKQQGKKVEMKREQHMVRCMFGHSYSYADIQSLRNSATEVEMIKTPVNEVPPPTAEKREIWVNPKAWTRLTERYQGRMHTTLGTIVSALAEDSCVFLSGEDVKTLRAMGLRSAGDIVAAMKSVKETEREMEELRRTVEKLRPVLIAAGVDQLL